MAKKSEGKFERPDGRAVDETRKITAKVGVIPNADGSAMFSFGDTIAIAAVYGPRKMHPQHAQNPQKGVLRCEYNMISFSVNERIRPGMNRRVEPVEFVGGTKTTIGPDVSVVFEMLIVTLVEFIVELLLSIL